MADWKEVAKVSEFAASDRKLVDLGDGEMIGVFKVGEEFFAVNGWCSHEKASLLHGDVEDHEVVCPVHGARFDLRTGRHLSLPAVRPIASYPVKVEGDAIFIRV
ncbi:MAG: 3-phenylpropionate/cinnamic acid dioxygenase ferredoxin subunit [Verrucomicrobia bacterium ADurb.Bin345]|nr:MAG: 3-phenylpropionate/cinnamic acid dioxygenase ferredoxin subunit [Verrucomicrobia bacterium ADurb.Bin345]